MLKNTNEHANGRGVWGEFCGKRPKASVPSLALWCVHPPRGFPTWIFWNFMEPSSCMDELGWSILTHLLPLTHLQRRRGGAESSKPLSMTSFFWWTVLSRSPPRVSSLRQKILLSLRNFKRFRSSVSGTRGRNQHIYIFYYFIAQSTASGHGPLAAKWYSTYEILAQCRILFSQ